MEGRLELNLNPPSMCFVSNNKIRRFRQCSVPELHKLLIDLQVLSTSQVFPKEEYLARINGDFSDDVLGRYGLVQDALRQRPKLEFLAS